MPRDTVTVPRYGPGLIKKPISTYMLIRLVGALLKPDNINLMGHETPLGIAPIQLTAKKKIKSKILEVSCFLYAKPLCTTAKNLLGIILNTVRMFAQVLSWASHCSYILYKGMSYVVGAN